MGLALPSSRSVAGLLINEGIFGASPSEPVLEVIEKLKRRFNAATDALDACGLTGNAELLQRPQHREVRLLNKLDDLQLLGGGISHSSSPPSATMLFLSRRFSSVRSATRTFMSRTSRRRSLTSPLVAARAVSPARRFLPASRNSFDQL